MFPRVAPRSKQSISVRYKLEGDHGLGAQHNSLFPDTPSASPWDNRKMMSYISAEPICSYSLSYACSYSLSCTCRHIAAIAT